MPAKKKVDYKKLITAIESGKPQAEIIKEFKFNTAAQFKSHYLEALMATGKAPEIKKGRGSVKSVSIKETAVSKRGSVVISKALIDELGFAVGDKFSVRNTKSGISLKKLA